jgi:hypothetical protein
MEPMCQKVSLIMLVMKEGHIPVVGKITLHQPTGKIETFNEPLNITIFPVD